MATTALTKDNIDEILGDNDIVLIDFWADWCGPCKTFGPIFEKASEEHPDVMFAKCDTQEQQELAGGFGIRSIPTLAVLRDRVLIYQNPGVVPGEALTDLITQAKALDMDEVRKQIAEHEAAHAAGGCAGCGHHGEEGGCC